MSRDDVSLTAEDDCGLSFFYWQLVDASGARVSPSDVTIDLSSSLLHQYITPFSTDLAINLGPSQAHRAFTQGLKTFVVLVSPSSPLP